MIRKINKNKFGVIEYAIDDEKDLQELPREDVDNTVYAIMKKGNKKLIYLYSKELKDYMLINGDLEGINAELENIKKQIGHTTQSSIPRVFFEGDTNGMSKENEKILRMSYRGKTEKIDGFVKMKWQGSSSLAFPKKNFTIKIFKEETCENKLKYNFKNWGNQNKYCLKANYIDHTHARNVVSARLWGEIVKNRSDYDTLPQELIESPNNAAIDGFPIKLYMNGKYEGLYTWNIPKDGWMFNMDENNVNNAVLCAKRNNNGNNSTTDKGILSCEFRELADISKSDWELEFPSVLNPNIKTSFNNLITCVKDTDDITFKSTIGNYLDIQSAIDYYIFMYYSCSVDCLANNLIMITYDGVKWYCSAYDMDNIWGSRGTNTFVDGNFKCPEQYQETNSLLWQRVEKCFGKELYNRYNELRNTVLSYDNIISKFEQFADSIPKDLYAEDIEIYSDIPYPDENNIKQILKFLIPRTTYCNSEFELFNAEPIEPTSITISGANTVKVGSTINLTVTYVPPTANTNTEITWSCNNSNATVNNGIVTGVTEGSCIITATTKNNKTSQHNITVEPKQENVVSPIVQLTTRGFNGETWTNDMNETNYECLGCESNGNAVLINGTDSYVKLEDANIDITNDFTIIMAFEPLDIGMYKVILGNETSASSNRITIGTPGGTTLFLNCLNSSGTKILDLISDITLNNYVKHTVSINKQGEVLKIYFDNSLVGTANDCLFTSSPTLYLGKNGVKNNGYLKENIYWMTYYNKSLTEDEIASEINRLSDGSGGESGGSISTLNFDIDENNFADFLLSGEELSDTAIKYDRWSDSDTDSTYSYFAIVHKNTVLNTPPTTETTGVSNYYSITNGDFSAVFESDIRTHSGNCVAFNNHNSGQTIIKIKKELIPTDDVEGLKKYLSTNFIFGKIKLNHTNTFTINMSNLIDVSKTWGDIVDSGNYYTFEKTITDQIPSNFTNNTKYYIPNFGMYHSHSLGMGTFITSTCNILYYKNNYILQGKIRKELLPSITSFEEFQDFFNNNPMKVYY